MQAELE